jgi:predicted O-methyltransferase YrrM
VKRAELIAVLRAATGAAALVLALALAAHLVAPAGVAPLIAIAAATFVVLCEVGRVRVVFARRLDELEADVAQTEPIVTLASRIPLRRPLPPMRGYAIAPDFALMLYDLVIDEKPELVVETGSGVSTLIVAYALEKLGRGRVVALDHDAAYAEKTRAEIARHGLEAYASVVHAPLEPIEIDGKRYRWHARSALDGLGPIDLVVDDGPPKYLGPMLRYASLPVFAPKLSPRGFVVLDVVGDEERTILDLWRQRFPEFAQERLATKKGNVILRRT